MKKLIFTLLVGYSYLSYSQTTVSSGLTQRQNLDKWVYKQGTRPIKGDLGFYVGASLLEIQKFNTVMPLSFINFRYYLKDDLVVRLGARFYKDKSVNNGTDEFTGAGNTVSGIAESVSRTSDREYYIKPGIEKHFALTNLLDVYVAADALLGVKRYTIENRQTVAGSEIGTMASRRSFDYGLGTYVGFQAFVADLPLSIGAEVGFQGIGSLWHRTKVREYSGNKESVYYLPVNDDFDTDLGATPYEQLSARRFDMNSTVRLIICYYFSR